MIRDDEYTDDELNDQYYQKAPSMCDSWKPGRINRSSYRTRKVKVWDFE